MGGNYPILCITPSVTKGLFNAEISFREDHFQFKIDVLMNRRSYFTSSLLSSSHLSIKDRCTQLNVFAGHNPLVSIN